jgi:hypothetical protein
MLDPGRKPSTDRKVFAFNANDDDPSRQYFQQTRQINCCGRSLAVMYPMKSLRLPPMPIC